MKEKIFSYLLVISLVLSLFPGISSAADPVAASKQTSSGKAGAQALLWSIGLRGETTLNDGLSYPNVATAAVNSSASNGVDILDIDAIPDPPSAPYLQMYFFIDMNSGAPYGVDSRPSDTNITWGPLVVDKRSNVFADNTKPVTVSWTLSGGIPANYSLTLRDDGNDGVASPAGLASINMRNASSYSYTNLKNTDRWFAIIASLNQPPVISNVLPSGGFVSGTTLSAQVSDADGTVATPSFYLSAAGTGTAPWTLLGNGTLASGSTASGVWNYNWNSATVSDSAGYKIKVSATDDKGASSEGFSADAFTVDNNAPGAPTLTAPADGLRSTVTTPAFNWTAVVDTSGVTYELQVDDDPAFGSPLNKIGLVATGYTLSGGEALGADGSYYWRVRAKEAAGFLRVGPYSASRTYTLDTTVNTPTLLTPADGSFRNSDPNFTWTAVIDGSLPVTYDLQVATSSFFNTGLEMEHLGLATNSHTMALSGDNLFYWRARARDGLGNIGQYSSTFSFRYDTTAPGSPTLQSPANSAVSVPLAPTFIWIAPAPDPSGIASYRLQVSTNPNLTAPVVNMAGIAATTATLGSNLNAITTYYWSVSATDGAGNAGLFSTPAFLFQTMVNPPIVTNVLPSGGFVSGTTLSAEVRDIDGTINVVEFFYSAAGTPPWTMIGNGVRVSGSAASGVWNFNWNSASVPDGAGYKIRAVAIDSDGAMGEGMSAAAFTVDNTAPPVPIILLPADGTRSNSNAPTFTWGAVADVSGVNYELQVDDDPAFGSPLNKTGLVTVTYTLSGAEVLGSDGSYYWRVRAKEATGFLRTSPYSASRTYILDTVVNQPTGLAPANGTITNVNTPALSWNAVVDPSVPVTYDLKIDDDPNMGSPNVATAGHAVNNFTPAALADGLWYWTVRAVDNVGNVSAYVTPSFSIRIDTTAPAVPNLISPPDNSDQSSLNVLLSWSASPDVTGVTYSLRVDDDPLFGSPVVSTGGLVLTSFNAAGLTPMTYYYWTVKAIDGAGNDSGWASPAWRFRINKITASAVWEAGWNLFSLPFDADPASFAGQFNELSPMPNVYRWVSPAYSVFTIPGIASGYWIKIASATNIEVGGFINVASTTTLALQRGWNMIGNPYLSPVAWGDARIRYTGLEKSIADAHAAGWVRQWIYGYNTTTHSYDSGDAITGVLEPYKGNWFLVLVSGAELIIPKP